MSDFLIPGPDLQAPRDEHEVAQAGRARALLESIPDQPEVLARLRGRHLLSIRHLDAPLIRQLMRLAARYEVGELQGRHPMHCRVLSNLFMDQSLCPNRLSFNSAWLRLGGSLMYYDQMVEKNFNNRFASEEIVELCNSYSEITILRTVEPETMDTMLPRFRIPVINAGNGGDEHPTHALADLYVLAKWRPDILQDNPSQDQRLTMGIIGTPSNTRTIRSLLLTLGHFPKAVNRTLLLRSSSFADGQREELHGMGLNIETRQELMPIATDMEVAREIFPLLDVLYVHHLQLTHVPRMKIIESVSHLNPAAMILNAEIQNEDLSNRFNDSRHNGYFTQARGSVFVRMAIYTAIMN